MIALNDNPFSWDPKGGVSGAVTSVSLSSGGNKIDVSGTDEPIEITMPREPSSEPPAWISFTPDRYVYHKVSIAKNNTALSALIIPQNYSNSPFNGSIALAVYVRRKFKPTKERHGWKFFLPKQSNESLDKCSKPSEETNYTIFISDKELYKGVYYIGVSLLMSPGLHENDLINVTVNYTLKIYMSQCKYWSDAKNRWLTDGCHVSY